MDPNGQAEALAGERRGKTIDDPAALMRFYQQTIRQIPMKVVTRTVGTPTANKAKMIS